MNPTHPGKKSCRHPPPCPAHASFLPAGLRPVVSAWEGGGSGFVLGKGEESGISLPAPHFLVTARPWRASHPGCVQAGPGDLQGVICHHGAHWVLPAVSVGGGDSSVMVPTRLCDPMDCSPDFSVHGIFPGKNTGVGCHFLLQGIFPTRRSNRKN